MTTQKNPPLAISRTLRFWRWLSVSRTMSIVIIALLFPSGAAVYFFGYHALMEIAVSVGAAIATEILVRRLRGLPIALDGSSVVTALILALSLPPTLPLWMAALGSFFAIAIAREAFGGLGQNVFNPAMAGRAFLQIAFPINMGKFIYPTGFNFPNAFTYASPLSGGSVQQTMPWDPYQTMLLGHTSGSLGETSELLILAGGLLLIATRVIDWRSPVTYIGTVALLGFALGANPASELLSGGLMLGAFFVVTDYVTAPFTRWGKVIFCFGAGIITVVIRQFGSLPEGVCFSVLIMNSVTPLIDRYVRIRPLSLKRLKNEVRSA